MLPSHLLPSSTFIPGRVDDTAGHVSIVNTLDEGSVDSVQESGPVNPEEIGENTHDFMQQSENSTEDPGARSDADSGGRILSGSGTVAAPGESPSGSRLASDHARATQTAPLTASDSRVRERGRSPPS